MARQFAPRDHDLRAPARLLAEAAADIVAASILIRRKNFDGLIDAVSADPNAPATAAANAETAYWIRRAVSAWGSRLPWRAKCFEQGIAAARMLRRRGLRFELHYGAANRTASLDAHVWVTSAGTPVVGCENALEFATIARIAG